MIYSTQNKENADMKKNLIVIGIILITIALSVATMPALKAQAQTPSPTAIPFTGAPEVVAMYPAMGEIDPTTSRPTGVTAPRGDDPTKTYAIFSPGTKNVPPGVPVYVKPGAIGLIEGSTIKSADWKLDKT